MHLMVGVCTGQSLVADIESLQATDDIRHKVCLVESLLPTHGQAWDISVLGDQR